MMVELETVKLAQVEQVEAVAEQAQQDKILNHRPNQEMVVQGHTHLFQALTPLTQAVAAVLPITVLVL